MFKNRMMIAPLFMIFVVAACGSQDSDQETRSPSKSPNSTDQDRDDQQSDDQTVAGQGDNDGRDDGTDDDDANRDPDDSDDNSDDRIDLRYPLIVHHGLLGGTGMGINRGIVQELKNRGVTVHLTEVNPAHSIATRAGELASAVDKILREEQAAKVNIIAHSMGGLDSRALISSLGYSDRVASLTTISTPHRGTPLADTAQSLPTDGALVGSMTGLFSQLINSSADSSELDLDAALANLTPDYLQNTFNPANPDQPGVLYQSYAGKSGPGSEDTLPTIMLPTWLMISQSAGDNDGVVPVSSAQWGEYKGTIAADHLDLSGAPSLSIGFFNRNTGAAAYSDLMQTIAEDLAAAGL